MKKKRKGLSARRAGSMALRVEVIGLTLFFGYFCIKTKVTANPRRLSGGKPRA
jgi:hypothetical protein